MQALAWRLQQRQLRLGRRALAAASAVITIGLHTILLMQPVQKPYASRNGRGRAPPQPPTALLSVNGRNFLAPAGTASILSSTTCKKKGAAHALNCAVAPRGCCKQPIALPCAARKGDAN